MQLYHALPFFFILLGQASKQKTLLGKLTEVGLYGTSVIVTSSVILSPFILFTNDPAAQLGQIAHRLFPFARGLFEDKVANVWVRIIIIVIYQPSLSAFYTLSSK